MTAKEAPSCRTGGARQRGAHQQAPVAAAIVRWFHTSLNPFPSCRTHIGGNDPTNSSSSRPSGDAESRDVSRKEASL